MKTKILSILALLLTVIVGEVQAQKSLPSKHGFEQNGMSANARETFGQNRKSANAREVQSATTAQTPSRRSVLRAPSTDVQAPTYVSASDITGASATVSWNGTGDSYNLRYGKMYWSEGFESCSHGQLPAGWTALDADDDGHSWFAYDHSKDTPNDYMGHPNSFDRMSAESESYLNGPLTPDNWLISPQVPLKGKLSLWAKGVDADYPAEHFAIYLSTTGKDVADFTTVLIPETVTQSVFTEYTADLSAYAGQVGYIAIRHFNVTDEWSLGVDNITITDDWVEADGVTSPYTLDGLDGLSIYEVQVQAVTGEQQSSWSTQRFKTLPTNATILYRQDFDDTNDINELGWTFVDNDGNGRNWTMSINGIFDKYEYSPSYTCTSVPNSLYSLSFTADGRSAINADNWAITPAIKIDESSILSFQLAYADPDYPDKVGVYVGETANVNEMTEVLAPTIFSRTAKHQFNEETVDLSAFAGKTCYIAFRHQDNEKYAVLIDDVTVYTIPPTYDLTLADGTEDAANWQGKAGEGKYQQLPLEGVALGAQVSLKYGGALKVKSVKAKKKAPANVAVTSITLNKTATEIEVGATETLSVTEVLPANATDPTYTWKTSDETKATVDQDGVVTAVAAGNVNIYAEANDGSEVQGTCAVTVTPAFIPVTAITLNMTETLIMVGSTETLSVTAVAPDNATDKTYTWKTSDETKATVDQNGVVTAVAEGTVTIYAEANDGSGVKGNCAVTVIPAFITVTAITLNKTATEIKVGATETLSVTSVLPEEATDKTYTWKTSNASVATVDQDGKVTAVAVGTVTIYAEANDGSGVKGNCEVAVLQPATITVTWNNDDITSRWEWENSFFKDGVTITAGHIDFDQKNFTDGGTFTTDPGFGNFTKIEVTTAMWDASGSGWSESDEGGIWTGNASSVSFDGSIMGMGQGTTTFVFTIELPN